ncbi:potassium channel family protein [Lentzea sp. BCCO 10_0856]|uniref:Potassium channel family protein n=1 Tax=Lentzea miocenica TaxID=3095431 RepID=A0ABU4STH6_9PSEU|nr:potassium channel family protein [Lentzea sp. BCCO 10_0856]MDX8029112.1 potassium channel family protein [Lentzea sp. BCCO 10_0856]
MTWAVVRPAATVGVLLLVYYRLPIDQPEDGFTVLRLVAALLLVVVVFWWQVRMIGRSEHPGWQGVQALALVIPLFLMVFAQACFLLARHQPGSFTVPLSRTDALYFVVTVFATVGFGDITPVSTTARVLVTVQMVLDLLLLGVALKVILAAVRRRSG